MTPAASRVAALDGLRGLAILWVLLHQMVVVSGNSTLERAILWPANFGWCGVTLFFALSGYLITGQLLDAAPGHTARFYARRTLRILPLYYALLALVFGVSLAAGDAFGVDRLTVGETASFWLLLGNLAQASASDWLVGPLAPTWSVAIEAQFYLLWPLVVGSLRRRTLAGLCVALVVACPLARLAAQATGASEIALYASTWARIDALAVGALAALIRRSDRAPRDRWLATALLACGLVAASGDLAGALTSHSSRYFATPFSLGLGMTLGAVASGPLLLLLTRPGRLTRAFEAPWLRSFGLYSYGIYLTHGPIRAVVRDHLFGPAGEGATPLVAFPEEPTARLLALGAYMAICLPLCWSAGWLTYQLIERPCLRLIPHREPRAVQQTEPTP